MATRQLIDKAVASGVNILFMQVRGVFMELKEKQVTENLELVPISIYNKTKMIAENVLMSYNDKIKIHCIRPATVCGLSPRMRFDVV